MQGCKEICIYKYCLSLLLYPLGTVLALKTLLKLERTTGRVGARLHAGKFFSDKKISFVLNPLAAHGSSQDKENCLSKENIPVGKPGLKNTGTFHIQIIAGNLIIAAI